MNRKLNYTAYFKTSVYKYVHVEDNSHMN